MPTLPLLPECPVEVPEQENQEIALLRAKLQERDKQLAQQK